MKKIVYLILFIFLFGIGFSSAITTSATILPSSANANNPTNWNYQNSVNSYQYNMPTPPNFNSYYSSSQISTYWPILNEMQKGNCEARSDFVVMIPSLGCTPAVVRSDLLEEQNVPVFCPLSAVRINPLIHVSSIRSISFKGNYSSAIADISFHPARAAIRSYTTLLGSPVMNDIGYVVIVLKKNPKEATMPEEVFGNLTATMYYDAENAFGTGRGEYYLPILSDADWESRYNEFGFWTGKGFLRLNELDNGTAKLALYTDKENVARQLSVRKGEVSSEFYFPGFYCLAGLQVKLNDIVGPDAEAKLNIDGDVSWVRKGTKFLNDKCSVIDLAVSNQNEGSILINCEGKKYNLVMQKKGVSITKAGSSSEYTIGKLVYSENGVNYYLGYAGAVPSSVSGSADKSFIVLVNSVSELTSDQIVSVSRAVGDASSEMVAQKLADFGLFTKRLLENLKSSKFGNAAVLQSGESNAVISFEDVSQNSKERSYLNQGDAGKLIEEYFTNLKEEVNYLIENYQNDQGDLGIEGSWASQALFDEMQVAARLGKYQTAQELAQKFLKTYPNSNKVYEVNQLIGNSNYNIQAATANVYVSNAYHSVSISTLKSFDPNTKFARITISGTGFNAQQVYEGETRYLANSVKTINESIRIEKINPNYVDITYNKKTYKDESLKNLISDVSEKQSIPLSGSMAFTRIGRTVSVSYIEVQEYAYVSLIPNVDSTNTQANFTFRIGIEKRAIELTPEKAKGMIENLNKTIESWDNINNKLVSLIKGWKGACFATSAMLMLKSWSSGLDGETIARQDVMKVYKEKCKNEHKSLTLTQCLDLPEIKTAMNSDISIKTAAIKSANNQIQSIEKANLLSQGGLFSEAVVDSAKVKAGMRDQLVNKNILMADGKTILDLNSITNAEDIPRELLQEELALQNSNGLSDAMKKAQQKRIQDLASPLLEKQNADKALAAVKTQYSKLASGGDFNIVTIDSGAKQYAGYGGDTLAKFSGIKGQIEGDLPDNTPVQVVNSGTDSYLLVLERNALDSTKYSTKQVYKLNSDGSGGYSLTSMGKPGSSSASSILNPNGNCAERGGICKSACSINENDIGASESLCPKLGDVLCCIPKSGIFTGSKASDLYNYGFISGGACSNTFTDAQVKYYETAPNAGMPAIVPFDLKNGWYAKVSQGPGGLLSSSQQGYKASGQVTFFYVCNVGKNHREDDTSGDDICQSFNINNYDQVQNFIGCPLMTAREVRSLAEKAQQAIREAAQQYGKKGKITILGQEMGVGAPASEQSVFECQDFMSQDDCKLLFNVCDPVICPTSRCNLGGKYTVSNVVQSGIIGSILLCLPNFREGVLIPVCLTGIQAGIDSLISILKSERDCLQRSIDTGEHVGICDEITSIYLCEFFWRQLAPVMNIIVPKLIESSYGGGLQGARGGGEYMTVMKSWESLQQNIDYFKNNYAQNAFAAFNVRSVEEAGGTFCKAFIGTSVPGSASLLDNLLAPESPNQVYAWFAETPYTGVTVPATSAYKVYYHIYAGKDQGSQYQVFLRNPPASSYYASNQQIYVKSGYIAKSESADETIDFTAPAGYKELCVVINAQQHCGFSAVSTDFALNYIQSKYIADQANQTSITTEKNCISGTPSALSLVNPNIQAGISSTINPDISLQGVVRICATSNPGAAVESVNPSAASSSTISVSGITDLTKINQKNIPRWQEVGYCNTPSMKCWLDTQSVAKDVKAVQAIEGSVQNIWDATKPSATQDYQMTVDDTVSILDQIRQAVLAKDGDKSINKKIGEAITGKVNDYNILKSNIEYAIGKNDKNGTFYQATNLGGSKEIAGRANSNRYLAESLYWKDKIYVMVLDNLKNAFYADVSNIAITGSTTTPSESGVNMGSCEEQGGICASQCSNTQKDITFSGDECTPLGQKCCVEGSFSTTTSKQEGFYLQADSGINYVDNSGKEVATGFIVKSDGVYLKRGAWWNLNLLSDVQLMAIKTDGTFVVRPTTILQGVQIVYREDLAKNYKFINNNFVKKSAEVIYYWVGSDNKIYSSNNFPEGDVSIFNSESEAQQAIDSGGDIVKQDIPSGQGVSNQLSVKLVGIKNYIFLGEINTNIFVLKSADSSDYSVIYTSTKGNLPLGKVSNYRFMLSQASSVFASDSAMLNFASKLEKDYELINGQIFYVGGGGEEDLSLTSSSSSSSSSAASSITTITGQEILENSPSLSLVSSCINGRKSISWTGVDKNGKEKQYTVNLCLDDSVLNYYSSKFGDMKQMECSGPRDYNGLIYKAFNEPSQQMVFEKSADKYIADLAQQLRALAIAEFPRNEQKQKEFIGLFVVQSNVYRYREETYGCKSRNAYPYEVLAANQGLCQSAAVLLSKLFTIYGFQSKLVVWGKDGIPLHMNSAITCSSCSVSNSWRKLTNFPNFYIFDVTPSRVIGSPSPNWIWASISADLEFKDQSPMQILEVEPAPAFVIDQINVREQSMNNGLKKLSIPFINYGGADAHNVKYYVSLNPLGDASNGERIDEGILSDIISVNQRATLTYDINTNRAGTYVFSLSSDEDTIIKDYYSVDISA